MASSGHADNDHPHELVPESSNGVDIVNGKPTKGPSCPLYSTYSLFDMENMKCLTSGAVLASCTPSFEQDLYGHSEPQEEKEVPPVSRDLTVPRKMACSVCATDFLSRADQIQHYKLDWHRFNLRERLKGNAPVTETVFDDQSGDMSSLSGSDSESESRTSSDVSSSPRHKSRPSAVPDYLRTTYEQSSKLVENSSETDETDDGSPKRTRMQPKVYFQNDDGRIIGLYRCVIHSKQNSPSTKQNLVEMLNRIPEESTWAVILVGGGHFAAGIFECSTVVEHKTFHRYTVRAKQGGSQSSKDGKQGHFNSAGATLRRYNESALVKDIQDLLNTWSCKLQACHRIFYRAASFNRSILFSGKNPPFKKDDPRLRTIPFPTRRATYSEVKRVHSVLSTLECFGDAASYRESLPVSPKMHLGNKKKKSVPCTYDAAIPIHDGSKCSKNSPLSSSHTSTENKDERSSNYDLDCPVNPLSLQQDKPFSMEEQLEEHFSSLSTDPAAIEFDDTDFIGSEDRPACDVSEIKVPLPPKKKKGRHKTNALAKRQKDPDADEAGGEKYQMKNSLYDACKAGNLDGVQKLLDMIVCCEDSPANPEGSLSIAIQSHMSDSRDILAEASLDICATSSDEIGPSENASSVNMPLEHVSTDSHLTYTLSSNCSELDTTTVQEIRHSSVEDRNGPDTLPSVSNFDKSTSSDYSTTHPTSSSVPSSPRSQQNRNQRSHSLSSKDDSAVTSVSVSILNEKINEEGTTLLHVATKEGYHTIVKALLENGADPTLRNRKGLTPYMVSSDKEMRNVYRRFMASHPELYDYNKAQIPSPLTDTQEAEKLEKSKEKKKLKKARMKEKKKEEEEKQKFLSLSDREKRAMFEERKNVQQVSVQSTQVNCPVLSRCFYCAMDITGKTPFEYLDFVFCSVACVKRHRASSSQQCKPSIM